MYNTWAIRKALSLCRTLHILLEVPNSLIVISIEENIILKCK